MDSATKGPGETPVGRRHGGGLGWQLTLRWLREKVLTVQLSVHFEIPSKQNIIKVNKNECVQTDDTPL